MARRKRRLKHGTTNNSAGQPLGELEREIIRLYNEGVPVREIMKKVNVKSMAKLYRILKRYAVPRKRKGKKWRPSGEEIAELCRLREKGWSIYQISRYFERSPSTIWHYARKFCTSGSSP